VTRRWMSVLAAALLAVLVTVPAASGPASATVTEPVGPTTIVRGQTWVGGGVMNPYRGVPVDVSCPTATWCMSVDLYGESLVFSGGTWANRQRAAGSTVRGDLQFRAVSCPTTSWCLATMANHRLAVWSSGTWTVVDVDEEYEDVSCWRTNGCGLTVSWGSGIAAPDFARWTDGSVTAKVAVPNRDRGMDVSCPTSTCFFLTAAGSTRTLYVHRITGSTTFTTTRAGASPSWGWESLACSSATSCMVTFDNDFRTMSGSTWSSTKRIDYGSGETVTPEALSCSSSSVCTAVGSYWNGMAAARWNGRTWSAKRLGAGANTERAIDCPTSSSCTVVDERGRFNRWNGSAWTARATFDSSRGGLHTLECPSSSTCVATDNAGNALEWSSTGGWSWRLLSESASQLDCTSSSFCMTLDWLQDSRRVRTSAGWQPANTSSHVYGWVTCATTTRCFAVSSNVVHPFSPSRDGELQSLPADLGNSFLAGDCGSSSFCLYVGSNGRSVSWNGSRWVSRGTVPGGEGAPPDVDCLSATFCVVAAGGSVSVLTPSGWRRIAADQPVSVSCRTTTSCFALGYDGGLRRWDGHTWTDTGRHFGDGTYGDGRVRCASTGRCTVLAEGRAWWTA
jgi:hypothetical protein